MLGHQSVPSLIRSFTSQRAMWLIVIDVDDIGQEDPDQIIIAKTGELFRWIVATFDRVEKRSPG